MSSASVPDLRRARPRPRPRPARRWSRATACHTTCHRHTQTVPTVSAEPPPSALNMTLPAFGAERRRRLLHGASCFRSISPARLALSSKPAGCSCYCRSMGQTDRQTTTWHCPLCCCAPYCRHWIREVAPSPGGCQSINR